MSPALVCDTSGLLAYFNSADPSHHATVVAVEAHDGPLVLSPYVAAELDYLVATRMGVTAERRYHDQQIGLADSSRSTAGTSRSLLRSMANRSRSCRNCLVS